MTDLPNPDEATGLKACPFCRGKAWVAKTTDRPWVDTDYFWVTCGTGMCVGAGCATRWYTKAEAVAAWNRRPAQSRADDQSAALALAVEALEAEAKGLRGPYASTWDHGKATGIMEAVERIEALAKLRAVDGGEAGHGE